jgi:antibiotic biosynthesis monooxygenase (ABM) superfamily enzyme
MLSTKTTLLQITNRLCMCVCLSLSLIPLLAQLFEEWILRRKYLAVFHLIRTSIH